MQIEFGDEVVTREGKKLGSVAGLVMNASTQAVSGLVLGQGLFGDERLVNISAVTGTANNVVSLNVDDQGAAELPPFVREEYVEQPRTPAEPLIMPAAGVGGPIFYDSSFTGSGYRDYPARDSFFAPAPLDAPVVETRSNLDENDVILKRGTDVVGADGKKVGTVDDIQFNEDGTITQFVVKAGFLFHHDLVIPGSAVAEFDDNRVLLSITSDQAEAAKA